MKLPVWLLALSATMLAQTISSFMGQCLPVVAPLMTASTGVAPERIGNLSSLTSFGSVLFLAFGSPLLARFGPIRSLQIGTLCAIVAMAIAALGWWPALLLSSVLLGLGYGPTPPAGSRILAATAPPQVWVKPSAELQFLYGNHVLKSGLGRITEGTPGYTGVVVYSMSGGQMGG